MAATRTQVYFTERQRRGLDRIAEREGRTLAAVVREAVDAFLLGAAPDRKTILDATFGAIPDFPYPDRSDWDRGYG